MNKCENKLPKPFIKWVGGKKQLIDELKNSLSVDILQKEELTYVEPFVGGGAVLFWILKEYPNIKQAVINDVNAELMCTYSVVKNSVKELICLLENYQAEYDRLDEEERKKFYLKKRDLYNSHPQDKNVTAALFILLNRICFNGLYRVNSQGIFNVPFGRYSNPKICDSDTLIADSQILQRVEILCGDFSQTERYAGKNTFFYFDPPYKPLSDTSSFTSYAKNGFDDSEQLRLRDFCNTINRKGALFIASNSDPMQLESNNFFDFIYQDFCIRRVMASRSINSNPCGRGKLSELLISNFK